MRSYFAIELTPGIYGGGYFEAEASFSLDIFDIPFQKVAVKIDTGCSISTIPVKRLSISNSLCQKLKEVDIDNNVKMLRSYGVETGGTFHFKPVTKKQKMDCSALKFKHAITDLKIENVYIPVDNIYLNYDRSGNVLIGMDILSKLISHIDVSRKTGKLMLLSAPRECVDKDFFIALKEHFGLEPGDIINT